MKLNIPTLWGFKSKDNTIFTPLWSTSFLKLSKALQCYFVFSNNYIFWFYLNILGIVSLLKKYQETREKTPQRSQVKSKSEMCLYVLNIGHPDEKNMNHFDNVVRLLFQAKRPHYRFTALHRFRPSPVQSEFSLFPIPADEYLLCVFCSI